MRVRPRRLVPSWARDHLMGSDLKVRTTSEWCQFQRLCVFGEFRVALSRGRKTYKRSEIRSCSGANEDQAWSRRLGEARSAFGGRRNAARTAGLGPRGEPDHPSTGSSPGPIRSCLPACVAGRAAESLARLLPSCPPVDRGLFVVVCLRAFVIARSLIADSVPLSLCVLGVLCVDSALWNNTNRPRVRLKPDATGDQRTTSGEVLV
jgi:hypothetical protein